jgi:hypothetical protein
MAIGRDIARPFESFLHRRLDKTCPSLCPNKHMLQVRTTIELSGAQAKGNRSGLIILHDPTSTRTDKDHFDFAMEVLKPVVDDMSWASGIMFQSRNISIADASPLLLMWAYQSIMVYRRLEQRYGDVVQEPLALIQEKFRIISRRW